MEDINSLFGGSDTPITILKKLIENDNIELKTDTNNKMIWTLAKIKWFSERQKKVNKDLSGMEILSDIVIPYILKLKVSKDRKSRSEIVTAITNLNQSLTDHEKPIINSLGK